MYEQGARVDSNNHWVEQGAMKYAKLKGIQRKQRGTLNISLTSSCESIFDYFLPREKCLAQTHRAQKSKKKITASAMYYVLLLLFQLCYVRNGCLFYFLYHLCKIYVNPRQVFPRIYKTRFQVLNSHAQAHFKFSFSVVLSLDDGNHVT